MSDIAEDHDTAIDEADRLIASNKIEGTAVYNEEGDRLGTIHSFIVDKQSGQVEFAVLSFGELFGLGADHYPLPWDALAYDAEQSAYVVDIDKEEFEKAPRYSADHEPVFDHAYGEQVYDYYGISYPYA